MDRSTDPVHNPGMPWLIVFVGGGLGSVARFALSRAWPYVSGTFPVATLLANVLACAVMGAFLAWGAPRLGPDWKLFVLTGFCGGFSTFSTFSLETLGLLRDGHLGLAAATVLVNVALCLGVLAVLARTS